MLKKTSEKKKKEKELESISSFSNCIGRKDRVGNPCEKNDLLHLIMRLSHLKCFSLWILKEKNVNRVRKVCHLTMRCLAGNWGNIWLISLNVLSKTFYVDDRHGRYRHYKRNVIGNKHIKYGSIKKSILKFLSGCSPFFFIQYLRKVDGECYTYYNKYKKGFFKYVI